MITLSPLADTLCLWQFRLLSTLPLEPWPMAIACE